MATDPALAEREARELLTRMPADPRVALILASALRRRGEFRTARTILEPLASAHPYATHTQYELGLVLSGCGEGAAAVEALRRAVELKPDQPEAWGALGDRLFVDGDAKGAEDAYREQARASVRDPRLKDAADALFSNRLAAAEYSLRAHLKIFPDDVSGLRMLAEVSARLGRLGDAESLLAWAITLDPDFDGARFDYAHVLWQQQRAVQAIAHVERLLNQNAGHPAYRNLLAGCLALLGEDRRVDEIYGSLLSEYGRQPKLWLNYGHALKTVGRRDEAMVAYRRCIELAPGLGEAYWSLANIKVVPFSAEDVVAMQAHIERPELSKNDRLHLHFALGRALEERRHWEGSFDHYAKGAAIRRGDANYDADETTARLSRSALLFSSEFFEAREGCGSDSDAPIFIVGLPRSGSTLIEQILASHPAVEGTMELPYIGLMAGNLRWPAHGSQAVPYPDVLVGLDGGKLSALGDSYLEAARNHCRLGRPFFVDKMPNNFQHLGLIRLILPKAKIIDARRHPLGTCFSTFKQLFAQGQGFSYDLCDLGRYYGDYVKLMSHFSAVLPGWIHRVIYEDLIEDTEGEIRRLLDYCGLPFDGACLRFYENDRAVRTVSSEQVRLPIFREGLDHWRHYEPWLGPLKRSLGATLESWRN